MESPITRAMLQANRQQKLDADKKNLVKHWTRRIYAAVVQESKQSDSKRFIFSDIVETTDPFSQPYTCCIPDTYVEDIVVELKLVFPDSDIQYNNRTITIDWS